MELLDKIKVLVAQKQITIAELERQIGLSNGQIRKWSNQTPGVDKVILVANYFNVSLDYLLGLSDNSVRNFSNDSAELPLEDAIAKVKYFEGRELNNHDRETIKNLAVAYLRSK